MTQRDARSVGVDDLGIQTQLLDNSASLSGECFIGLDHVDFFQLDTRSLQHLSYCWYRPDAHVIRIYSSVRVTDQASQRSDSKPFCRLPFHQQQGSSPIIQARCIARGDGAVLRHKNWLHCCQLLNRDLRTDILVTIEQACSLTPFNLNGNNLAIKITLGNRSGSPTLTLDCRLILCSPINTVTGRYIFGCNPHVVSLPRVMENAIHVIDCLAVTQACAPAEPRQYERPTTHALGTSADGDIGISQQDRLRR